MASEIDYLICATLTADHYFPGCGVQIQHKLGMPHLPALDIRQQCAGYVYGMQLADVLIRSGSARTVLLIGVEVHSAFFAHSKATWAALHGDTDQRVSDEEYEWNTRFRYITPLFGDAGGAMVLGASTEADGDRGVLACELHSDGSELELLYVPGVGSCRLPMIDQQSIDEGLFVPRMEGRGLFKAAVQRMPEVTRSVLSGAGYTLDDLDFGIFHQANLRINQAAQKALGLPDSKVHNNIDRHGNTTAATLPLCYYEAREAGKVKPGDLVVFTAFGAGLQWGSVLVRL
jgi:3-oxoacyl-[acyl-carrier-protein] synthase-3